MKPGGPLKRYVPLARKAFKPKRRQPAVPDDVRALLLERSGGWCEIRLEGCQGRGVDPSHRKGSKAGGRKGAAKQAHDVASNALWACRSCHNDITSASGERLEFARDTGLLVLEHEDPAEVPVTLPQYGPVYLTDCGGLWPADLTPIHEGEEMGA